MCVPNLGATALTLQGASAASSAVGAYYSSRSQKDALGFQADLEEYQAQNALLQGEREMQRSRLSTAQLKSTQRASMAANGVDLSEGTPARVLTSTDLLGEIDAQTIQQNALRSAWGYRTDAAMKRASADAISPLMAGGVSLLGGGAQVASSWYYLKKAGALG